MFRTQRCDDPSETSKMELYANVVNSTALTIITTIGSMQ